MDIEKYLSSYGRQEGKTFLVTGASSGLGLEAAKHLARLGGNVLLAARNEERLKVAVEKLKAINLKGDYRYFLLDQSDAASIEAFVKALEGEKIDAVIYNAGIYFPRKGEKGLTFKTNAVGTYLLSRKLLALYPKARHVYVGSIMHFKPGKKGFENALARAGRQREYALSKEAIRMIFHLDLEAGYDCAYVHPGISKTSIIRSFAPLIKRLANGFLYLFVHHPVQASLVEVVGAIEDRAKGQYVYPKGVFQISGFPKMKKAPAYNQEEAEDLRGFMERLSA